MVRLEGNIIIKEEYIECIKDLITDNLLWSELKLDVFTEFAKIPGANDIITNSTETWYNKDTKVFHFETYVSDSEELLRYLLINIMAVIGIPNSTVKKSYQGSGRITTYCLEEGQISEYVCHTLNMHGIDLDLE